MTSAAEHMSSLWKSAAGTSIVGRVGIRNDIKTHILAIWKFPLPFFSQKKTIKKRWENFPASYLGLGKCKDNKEIAMVVSFRGWKNYLDV